MWVKVRIEGSQGNFVEGANDIVEVGELAKLIHDTIAEYRETNPDAMPFDYKIDVSST